MDAGFLNYHKEEEFSSFFLEPSDVSDCYDEVRNQLYTLEWDSERELNGDIALIPTISNNISIAPSDFCPLSTSPPSNSDEFHRIVSDWQNAVKLDHEVDDLTVDVTICTNDIAKYIQNTGFHNSNQIGNSETNFGNTDKFDLTEYINDIDDRQRLQKNSKIVTSGGKKIDINAQRYVLKDEKNSDSEDDAVDVETLSDSDQTSPLVLQASDVNTLLEQFEANETTNSKIEQKNIDSNSPHIENINIDDYHIKSEPDSNDYEIATDYKLPNFVEEESGYLKPTPIDEIISQTKAKLDSTNNSVLAAKDTVRTEKINNKITNVPSNNNNKETSRQILNALPAELIDRIRQNSKRKPITVIPPIVPTKKRSQQNQIQVEKATVILDHTYCTKIELKKEINTENDSNIIPRKDSGFSSAEEDEQRAILRLQPKVKNADGTLMVSLLKSNTIIKNAALNPIKRKLNLEEYKKRRSENVSGQNSPLLDEDENTRRLRHQQMLMKMAYEVINQNKVSSNNNNEINEVKVNKEESIDTVLPQKIIKKTLVSIGTNTEESWGHVEQILEKTKVLPPNSLISSIVAALPLIKIIPTKQESEGSIYQHGEDKTIMYIDANTAKPDSTDVATQTIRTTMKSKQPQEQQQRRQFDRRNRQMSRRSSSSSTNSGSSRSSSSSRSRSSSPNNRKRVELECVVEERRVIYVGRIEDGMTREELRRRFARFGPICNVSTHFRTEADNYGFVTFVNKEDAYTAVEYGNSHPGDRQYDLSFGGRRLFCQQKYSDLDRVNDADTDTYYLYNTDCPVPLIAAPSPQMSAQHLSQQQRLHLQASSQSSSSPPEGDSFDELLRAAQAKLQRKRQQLFL